jgi:hypothetical protein
MEDSGLNGGRISHKLIAVNLHMPKIVVCKCRPQMSELYFTSVESITHLYIVIFLHSVDDT